MFEVIGVRARLCPERSLGNEGGNVFVARLVGASLGFVGRHYDCDSRNVGDVVRLISEAGMK